MSKKKKNLLVTIILLIIYLISVISYYSFNNEKIDRYKCERIDKMTSKQTNKEIGESIFKYTFKVEDNLVIDPLYSIILKFYNKTDYDTYVKLEYKNDRKPVSHNEKKLEIKILEENKNYDMSSEMERYDSYFLEGLNLLEYKCKKY